MIVAPFLKLRDKITRKRQALTEDAEKPFLEHLEDLRKTMTKVIITLTVAVVGCFVFYPVFFKILMQPIDAAGLEEPKEMNLPAAVMELPEAERQAAWWKIHSTARGMAYLDGTQRELFLETAAPDDFTRQFAHAMILYAAADGLQDVARPDYLKHAAARVPDKDKEKVAGYAAQLTASKTPVSLETPPPAVETESFGPAEIFMLSMKLSLFAGIIVAFPLLFFFLLEFILPGLTQKERKMIFPALGIGFALFLTGVLFAYFVVVPKTLVFFNDFGAELGIKNRWRVANFISFETSLCLIFGVAFELPVVVMVMVKLGLLTSTTMRRTRSWAFIIILVSSAVLTPTGDAFTMSFLAAPMIIMYEACIWLAVLHERRERKREAAEQRRDEARRAALIGVASVQAANPNASASATEEQKPSEEPKAESTADAAVPSDAASISSEPETETSNVHPYHPETVDEDEDYEKYMCGLGGVSREHTHTESVPVEERSEHPDEDTTPDDPDTKNRD